MNIKLLAAHFFLTTFVMFNNTYSQQKDETMEPKFFKNWTYSANYKQDSLQYYFPLNSYLGYNPDALDSFRLMVYSRLLYFANEPISYHRKSGTYNYYRFILIDSIKTTIYRMEWNGGNSKLTIKKIYGNCESELTNLEEYTFFLSKKEYLQFYDLIMDCDIWRVRPYNSKDFAWSNDGIIVFESNQYSGYCLVDIYKPFTQKQQGFKNFYQSIKYLDKFHN